MYVDHKNTKKEAEVFRKKEDNIFKDFTDSEELLRYYQAYVKKNGASFYINDMYARRMSELDIEENYRRKHGFK